MALGGDLGPSPPAEVGGPSDLHEVPHPGAPPDTLGPFAPVPEEAPAPPPVVSEFPRQSFREEPKGTSPHAPVLPRPRGPSPPS